MDCKSVTKIHFADRETEARWLRDSAFGQGIQESLRAGALAGLPHTGDWRSRRVQASWQQARRRCFWKGAHVWTAFVAGDSGLALPSWPLDHTTVGSRGPVSSGSVHWEQTQPTFRLHGAARSKTRVHFSVN